MKALSRKAKIIIFTILAVIVVLVLAFSGLAGFITDYLWFKDLDYVQVFLKQLITMLQIGVPVFVVLCALAVVYLRGLRKGYYKRVNVITESVSVKFQHRIGLLLSAVGSGLVTYMAVTRLWYIFLQFTNATSFGVKDPIFNNDVSFYVFKLQFIRDLNNIIIVAVIVFAALTFLYYFFLLSVARPKNIVGAASAEPEEEEAEEESTQQQAPFSGGMNFGGGLGKLFASLGFAPQGGQSQQRRSAKPAGGGNSSVRELLFIATRQIMVLGIIFFLMLSVNYFLKQFDLLFSGNGTVYGAGFMDINISLWVYRLIMVMSLVAAVMFAIGVSKKKIKTIITVPIAMIVISLLGTGVGMAVQALVVSPDEVNKERLYLGYNIEFTQAAYGLQNVETKQFPATNDLDSEKIKANVDTIKNIRINDYEPTQIFYNNQQTIRQYYAFNNVNVDRYMINGAYTQTFLSAREIDETKIPQQWLNLHLKYTHGYGITLSRVDKVTASGQPDILIRDIPPVSAVKEIEISRPEIYFGELQNHYILVNTSEKEFDYPQGDNNVYSTYTGETGIKMNLFNRIMFAIQERDIKLLVSGNIKGNSKIIINRNIKQRVQKIMPYLDYAEPYMATVDGKLYWITDAFTTSNRYPYSEPYSRTVLDPANRDPSTNYIRNSIKVVIDAYSGETNYYLVDENDPVAGTMKNIYPKLFKSLSQMPEGLRAHIRYPSRMLNIQANIYKKYHVDDIMVFYQGEDRWDIASEKVGASEKEVPMSPNYYIMKLPGEKAVEFINSIPYTPMNKKNMTSLLLARNDGDDYGKLVLFQLPKGKIVMGPSQIDAQIAQEPNISRDFSLWENSGSTYRRGNMFVIPIEDSIMYVEPIYLNAKENSIPEVKKIILYYGDRIAYEDTLAKALDSMFGEGTGDAIAVTDPTGEDGDSDSPTTTPDPNTGDGQQQTTDQIIQGAVDAYNAAVAAQKAGDWTKYGQELKRLEDYLNQLAPDAAATEAETTTTAAVAQ